MSILKHKLAETRTSWWIGIKFPSGLVEVQSNIAQQLLTHPEDGDMLDATNTIPFPFF